MRPNKTYYFICRDCHERKTQAEESFLHPGVCNYCYQTLDKYAPADEPGILRQK